MQEAATGVLIGRNRQIEGLQRMVTLSIVAHAAIMAGLFVVPRDWLASQAPVESRPMMVSLSTPAGADTGGMTSISTRKVQEAAPANERPTLAPAAEKPMAMPDPTVKPKPVVTKPVPKSDDKSSTRKPSTGAEVRTGSARVETKGAEIPFGGLASGGGGTGGVRTDSAFCCPDYIELMKKQIYDRWNQQAGAFGLVEIKFTIHRDGRITNIAVEKSSGNPLLDLESSRAVDAAKQLAPLPQQYTNPTLIIYLQFEYKRR